jgi:hypothetical protein
MVSGRAACTFSPRNAGHQVPELSPDRSETNQEATAQSRTEFLFVSDPSGSSGRSVGSGHNPGVQSFIQRELHRKKAVIRLAKLRNEHHFPLGHPQPTQLDPFSGALLPVTKRQRFFLSYCESIC